LGSAEAAQLVVDDGVDILVDLAGHTAHNRLDVFALRPAPVQVSWIGYPNTTGLPGIGHRITDGVADAAGSAADMATAKGGAEWLTQRFSEALLRMPGAFLCYTPHQPMLPVATLPALENGHVTFGTYNNLAKIQPEVVSAWAAVLHRVPRSRLVLKSKAFESLRQCERYYQRFEAHGVARERLDLLGLIPHNTNHLQAYALMDISLDPFPYAGTTTTFEALLMGVPVVTLRGQTHAHNVGASILTALGRLDWISESAQDYVRVAATLAADVLALAATRARLRDELLASPLCDGNRFVRELEGVYESISPQRMSAASERANPGTQEE
jgi:protein O-GlcNAc transferase